MNQDPVTVRHIQWDKVFPARLLLKAAGIAFSVQVLVPVLGGVLLCNYGHDMIEEFLGDELASEESHGNVDRPRPDDTAAAAALFGQRLPAARDGADETQWYRKYSVANRSPTSLPRPVTTLVRSVAELLTFRNRKPLRPFVQLLWHSVVLGFVGIAVGRATAESACRHSRIGVFRSLKFAATSTKQLAVSTLLAGIVVGIPWLMCFVARWVYGVPGVGQPVVSIAWPLVILASLLTIAAAATCLIGWLLSLAAIATDRCKGSDALSRGISYCLSHRLQTIAHGAFVLFLMWVAGLLARPVFAAADEVLTAALFGLNEPAGFSASVIDGWTFVVGTLPEAFQLGIFFCGTTIAYLLLRHTEDGIAVDEMDGA